MVSIISNHRTLTTSLNGTLTTSYGSRTLPCSSHLRRVKASAGCTATTARENNDTHARLAQNNDDTEKIREMGVENAVAFEFMFLFIDGVVIHKTIPQVGQASFICIIFDAVCIVNWVCLCYTAY